MPIDSTKTGMSLYLAHVFGTSHIKDAKEAETAISPGL